MEKDQEVPFFSQFIALALLAFLVSSACYAIRQPSQNLAESAEPPAVRVEAQRVSGQLPVYGSLNSFSFMERNGQAWGSEALKGRVWIADFIYTSCTTECPLMTAEMARLQQALSGKEHVHLVSFSVDPERDTPQKLTEYAARFQADAKIWKFLTGPREALYRLAQKEFHLPVQALEPVPAAHAHHESASAQTKQDEAQPFLHSQKFVLVDSQLQIRGYYDSTRSDELERLLKTDLPRLLQSF
ncbi:SCO family protein [bacterium (Candidatus Blackallbacteria) CG17_big_fil_post_rev_8_21_14_2_50_48_46]|uniref:SCO family protein n=1 Tax=bacterium (Candidatus Blackallbacteria) CG17_big_fil_post_rev_8_21_14_2_50_48_46 TaxID=2014261 RepID=A0A2M7GB54_9BACT|nr:MAG: photosynthetic protein synthase I [bacterium (Candidatus Blackallbacteria) CG18_big_fil_WC_8_21_14_2_50_49_26]PIW19416.1 MAG: SCO family protein [bacterium (Candidatus Blackallbacteria) CG17_big_fil_post_rev_8_21_14_2_50_48_46]PIW48980.1 MAG: SCO family protein [bacterium (Candidatus Blackallbacteria) CG13_big_fil_rev_8_21_14_2_50_49_14]